MLLLVTIFIGAIALLTAIVFASSHPKYRALVFWMIAAAVVSIFFYLSSPVCQTLYKTSEVKDYVGMPAEELLRNHTGEKVGTFVWSKPAWSQQGDSIVACGSRFQSIFAIH